MRSDEGAHFETQPINLDDIARRLEADVLAQASGSTGGHDRVSDDEAALTNDDAFKQAFIDQSEDPLPPASDSSTDSGTKQPPKPKMTLADLMAEIDSGVSLGSHFNNEEPVDEESEGWGARFLRAFRRDKRR